MTQRGTSADSAMTVRYFACSRSDLKTAVDASGRELTLHTVFGENAKGLDHVTPRWIIEC